MKKVYVFIRCIEESLWKAEKDSPIKVLYCGYLKVDDLYEPELWHLCNWSCWNYNKRRKAVRPNECRNLMIEFCNSDVSFYCEGKWYSHAMKEFKDFSECYYQMTHKRCNNYFQALWPIPTFNGKQKKRMVEVTPSNINQIIK